MQIENKYQARGWALTLFNYSEEDYNAWKALEDDERVRWMIFGKEICPKSKKPHLQGAIFLHRKTTMKGLKKILGRKDVHCSNWYAGDLHGADDNAAYCSKDGVDVHEFGERPHPGKRVDLQAIREIVDEHKSMRSVLQVASNYQQLQIAKVCLTYVDPPKRPDLEVYWFWGPTGCGKSFTASEEAGPDVYRCHSSNQWWDGYDGQLNVIIDDYRRDFCKFHDLLRLLDKYPMQAPIKGAYVPLCFTRLWITAPKLPKDMWEGRTEEDLEQLHRRLHEVRYFGTRYATALPHDQDDVKMEC